MLRRSRLMIESVRLQRTELVFSVDEAVMTKRQRDDETWELYGSGDPATRQGMTPRRFKKALVKADARPAHHYSSDELSRLSNTSSPEPGVPSLRDVVRGHQQHGQAGGQAVFQQRVAAQAGKRQQDTGAIIAGVRDRPEALPRAVTIANPGQNDSMVGGRTRTFAAASIGQSFPTNRIVNRFAPSAARHQKWVASGGRTAVAKELASRGRRLRDDPAANPYSSH